MSIFPIYDIELEIYKYMNIDDFKKIAQLSKKYKTYVYLKLNHFYEFFNQYYNKYIGSFIIQSIKFGNIDVFIYIFNKTKLDKNYVFNLSCKYNQQKIAEYVYNLIDIQTMDISTNIYVSIEKNNIEIFKFLLLLVYRNKEKKRAYFHYSYDGICEMIIKSGHIEMLIFLYETMDKNIHDKLDNIALFEIMCINSNNECVLYLLEFYKNIISKIDNNKYFAEICIHYNEEVIEKYWKILISNNIIPDIHYNNDIIILSSIQNLEKFKTILKYGNFNNKILIKIRNITLLNGYIETYYYCSKICSL